ncbi:hypothetical protein C8R47DRAFT_632374 [Mycena vitilis]|nr:hypothetical protein C8R47DRAFT_632374 [Mycena vitilis]
MHRIAARPVSRAELAFEQAEADAKVKQLVILKPSDGIFEQSKTLPPPDDFVKDMIDTCRDDYDKLVHHPYPKSLADGTASLDGFRFYMIQVKWYIENHIRLRMAAIGVSTRPFEEVESFALDLPFTIKYAKTQGDVCVNELGIPRDVVNSTVQSSALQQSRAFYTQVAQDDKWFAMHIALLPCIMGYWEITDQLLKNPSTARNTLYHPLWTVLNADESYVEAYRYFLNMNYEPPTEEVRARWIQIFRQACKLECKFFDVAQELNPLGVY